MNLRQLEILRAVIRHRTTVAAADELALSQPAISNALKAMEAQAGFALFERVNNRLFPTTEAMALYKESDAIFALHAKLENRVRDLRENRTGHLSIVATPPLAYSIIPPALSNFPAPPSADARLLRRAALRRNHRGGHKPGCRTRLRARPVASPGHCA
jgi:Transcriptional regulator